MLLRYCHGSKRTAVRRAQRSITERGRHHATQNSQAPDALRIAMAMAKSDHSALSMPPIVSPVLDDSKLQEPPPQRRLPHRG